MADNTERIQCLGGNVNHLVWLEAKWSRTRNSRIHVMWTRAIPRHENKQIEFSELWK